MVIPIIFLYKNIKIDRDLLDSLPVDGYLSDMKTVEFDANEDTEFDLEDDILPDLGPTNSEENIYHDITEMGSFLPGNLNSGKEKVIINNEVLTPQTHELTLG